MSFMPHAHPDVTQCVGPCSWHTFKVGIICIDVQGHFWLLQIADKHIFAYCHQVADQQVNHSRLEMLFEVRCLRFEVTYIAFEWVVENLDFLLGKDKV